MDKKHTRSTVSPGLERYPVHIQKAILLMAGFIRTKISMSAGRSQTDEHIMGGDVSISQHCQQEGVNDEEETCEARRGVAEIPSEYRTYDSHAGENGVQGREMEKSRGGTAEEKGDGR